MRRPIRRAFYLGARNFQSPDGHEKPEPVTLRVTNSDGPIEPEFGTLSLLSVGDGSGAFLRLHLHVFLYTHERPVLHSCVSCSIHSIPSCVVTWSLRTPRADSFVTPNITIRPFVIQGNGRWRRRDVGSLEPLERTHRPPLSACPTGRTGAANGKKSTTRNARETRSRSERNPRADCGHEMDMDMVQCRFRGLLCSTRNPVHKILAIVSYFQPHSYFAGSSAGLAKSQRGNHGCTSPRSLGECSKRQAIKCMATMFFCRGQRCSWLGGKMLHLHSGHL